MSLSNEAKESLLQAMNIIASKATNDLAFDSTIKGIIVNKDHASDGYYTVSYGNTKFTAYSENSSYKINECVRVSIPNNDFLEKKYILGKWAGDDGTEPITYVSVANSVLEVVNLINDQNLNVGLEANGASLKKSIELPDMSSFFGEVTQNEIFDTLFIEVGIQSRLENYQMAQGDYGVRILIYDKTGYIINTMDLNSVEFFGNPYAFTVPVQQSKKLNISDLGQIGSIGVEFYQSNNFLYLSDEGEDSEGRPIKVQIREVPIEATGASNLFVKNLRIGFGTDLSQVEDNTVKIYCNNDSDLSYEYSERSKEKDISLIWYNKTSDNIYVGFSDGLAKKSNSTESISYYNYDENDYLKLSAAESRLKSQISDTTPSNELSLQLKANTFLDGGPAVKEVYNILSKDLPATLQSISTRIGSNCRDITDELDSVKEKTLVVKETFDEEIVSLIQPTYSVRSYEKGKIIKDSEFKSIAKIKYDKKWRDFVSTEEDRAEDGFDKNDYFASVDRIEYVVKKDMDVKIKKDLKIYPVEQQIIDILTFGKECQVYKSSDTKDIDRIYPSYDIIKEIYSTDGKGQTYNFITSSKITELIEKITTSIRTCCDNINVLTRDSYKSFEGVWSGQCSKLEAFIQLLNDQKEKISNNLPTGITTSFAGDEKKVTVNFKVNGVSKSLTYSSTANWTWEDWESDFDDSLYDNLYSIYWFQYAPGWEPEEDSWEAGTKIKFKDWKNISPNVPSLKTKHDNAIKKIDELINDLSSLTSGTSAYEEKEKSIKNQVKKANKIANNIISVCGLQNNKKITYNETSGFGVISSTEDSAYSVNNTKNSLKYGLITFKSNVLKNLPSHINFGLPSCGEETKGLFYWNKNSTGENIPQKEVTLNHESNNERFKVVIVYNHNRYESNEVVFSNIDKAVNLNLEDKDFQISHSTESRDSYQDLYNFTSEIISPTEATKERAVYAEFKNETADKKEVFNNSWIYWYVPSGATMISYDEDKLLDKDGYGFYTDKQKTVQNNSDSATYYKWIMDGDIGKTKDVSKKIIIYDSKKISNVTYYCINKESSYYLSSNNVDLCQDSSDDDVKNYRLVYPKDKGTYSFYYETTPSFDNKGEIKTGLSLTFSEKSEIKGSTQSEQYPNLYVEVKIKQNNGTFKNEWKTFDSVKENKDHFSEHSGIYTFLYQMRGCYAGVSPSKTDTYGGDNFYFLNTSGEVTKAIQVKEGDHIKNTTIKLYPTSTEGKFMAKENLTVKNGLKIGYVKGSSKDDKTAKLYKYYIKSYGSNLPENQLYVIDKEFHDSLTNKDYYKLYNQNIYLLKSQFSEIEPKYGRKGYYCFYKKVAAYKSDGTLDKTATDNNKKFYYKIKSLFNQDATNNSILCGIVGDRWGLEDTLATKSFSFGTYGANGTEYSIRVEPERRTISGKIKTLLKIKLYNGTGEEQDFSEPILSWVGPTSCIIESLARTPDGYLITLVDRVDDKDDDAWTGYNYYAALKIEIKLEEVDLETIYAIPYSKKESYCIDGTSSVVYNMSGNTEGNFHLDPYKIYDTASSTVGNISGVTWSIVYVEGTTGGQGTRITDSTTEGKQKIRYLPKFDSSTNTLQPLKMYINNIDCYATVICEKNNSVLWAQPIVILQNRFMSSTLNRWSGEFEINEDAGTILSAMVGAGKKNPDNSFSGVLMGDVREKGEFNGVSKIQTGLYGFHEGSASFGFDINGTAFLGKTGKGRISFDGNHGFISSALWDGVVDTYGVKTLGSQGMLIDLENGHIDAHDFRLTSQNIGLDSNPVINDNYGEYGYYIRIGNNTAANKTRGYLTLNSNGDLDIRVNSFHLTEQLGGANLLRQSQPTKMVTQYVIPTSKEISDRTSGLTIVNLEKNGKYYKADSDGNLLFEMTDNTYSKYKYAVDSQGEYLYKRNNQGHIMLFWDVDTSLKDPKTSQWVGITQKNPKDDKNYSTSLDGIDSFSYKKITEEDDPTYGIVVESAATTENAVCIQTSRPYNKPEGASEPTVDLDAYIEQTIEGITPGEKYTLSGYVRRRKIDVSGKNQTLRHRFYATISDSENLPLSEANLNKLDSVLISNQEWTYFEKNVILKNTNDTSASENLKNKKIKIRFKCDVDFLLYHAKFEQGSVATDWEFSKWDIEQGAKNEVDAYDKQLTQDVIFKHLITNPNNGEQMVGLWMIDKDPMTEEPLTHKELYINATYIATGILRSRNWNGDITRTNSYYYNENGTQGNLLTDQYGRPIYTYNVSFKDDIVPRGMYINLDEGKVWAATFELNAWRDNQGLYLNSHPNNGERYLEIGKDNNEIKFELDSDGNSIFSIKATVFKLDAWNSNTGIYINSDVGTSGTYLNAGEPNTHIKVFKESGQGKIEIKAWIPESGTGENKIDSHGVVIRSHPTSTETSYFRVKANDNNELRFYNNSGTKTFSIKASNFTLKTSDNKLYISNTPTDFTIGTVKRESIVFRAGDKFFVDSSGNLFATSANISGTITGSTIYAKTLYAGGNSTATSTDPEDYIFRATSTGVTISGALIVGSTNKGTSYTLSSGGKLTAHLAELSSLTISGTLYVKDGAVFKVDSNAEFERDILLHGGSNKETGVARIYGPRGRNTDTCIYFDNIKRSYSLPSGSSFWEEGRIYITAGMVELKGHENYIGKVADKNGNWVSKTYFQGPLYFKGANYIEKLSTDGNVESIPYFQGVNSQITIGGTTYKIRQGFIVAENVSTWPTTNIAAVPKSTESQTGKYVLKANGTGDPSWAQISASLVNFSDATVTSNATVSAYDKSKGLYKVSIPYSGSVSAGNAVTVAVSTQDTVTHNDLILLQHEDNENYVYMMDDTEDNRWVAAAYLVAGTYTYCIILKSGKITLPTPRENRTYYTSGGGGSVSGSVTGYVKVSVTV